MALRWTGARAVATGAVGAGAASWLPWAGSLALHAGLVLTAAGLAVRGGASAESSGAGAGAGAVSIAFAEEPAPSRRAAPALLEPAERAERPGATGAEAARVEGFGSLVGGEAALPTPVVEVSRVEAPALAGVEILARPASRVPAVSAGGGERSASAPEVFGVRGESDATRVVYVVDGSGSMVAAFPTIVREVERSIDGLGESHWVQVIVFKGSGYESAPTPAGVAAGSLVRATPENKRALRSWLGTVRAERGTDAMPALERAIALKPDVVFLLSKGLADAGRPLAERDRVREAALARLESLNPAVGAGAGRGVSIQVIHFFDPDPTGVMREIARRHGGPGGFTFLSRKDLGLE